MTKKILMALTALTLSAGTLSTASAASATFTAGVQNSGGTTYSELFTEAAWQYIRIPLSAIGGVYPSSNLTLDVTGLPTGVTITLNGVTQDNNAILLSVDTERTSLNTRVNAIANIALKSGSTVLTNFQVPVVGLAYDQGTTFSN